MNKFIAIFLLLLSTVYADSLEEIKQKGEIRIGVWKDQPPFSNIKEGKFEGFEVIMGKNIGKRILGKNGKVTFVALKNNQERIDFLEDNRVDLVLANFTKTKERAKLVDFTMPYFSVALGAVMRNSENINNLKDFVGKKIAVRKNTSAEKFAKSIKGALVIVTDISGEAFRMVKDKRADVYMNDNLMVFGHPVNDSSVKIPRALRSLGRSEYLCPAVKKGNTSLKNEIDRVMIELSKEGFFKNLYNETFAPFYKNMADPKYFLLEDLYRMFI